GRDLRAGANAERIEKARHVADDAVRPGRSFAKVAPLRNRDPRNDGRHVDDHKDRIKDDSRGWHVASLIPIWRNTSCTAWPESACFSANGICCLANFDFLIASSS